jgi:hypothetical protein
MRGQLVTTAYRKLAIAVALVDQRLAEAELGSAIAGDEIARTSLDLACLAVNRERS